MKKTMKKSVALLLVVVFALSLAACGGKDMSDSKYVGEWELTKGVASGVEVSASDMNLTMTFNFKSDGKFEYSSSVAGSESSTGTWDETDNGVVLTEVGGAKYEFTANGDALEMEQDGATLVFEKK